jgi:hypothetical protein
MIERGFDAETQFMYIRIKLTTSNSVCLRSKCPPSCLRNRPLLCNQTVRYRVGLPKTPRLYMSLFRCIHLIAHILMSILILSSHISLCLPNDNFSSVFTTSIISHFLSPMRVTYFAYLIIDNYSVYLGSISLFSSHLSLVLLFPSSFLTETDLISHSHPPARVTVRFIIREQRQTF